MTIYLHINNSNNCRIINLNLFYFTEMNDNNCASQHGPDVSRQASMNEFIDQNKKSLLKVVNKII